MEYGLNKYNIQLTTHQLAVVVVITATVESPRCLQVGQRIGRPYGGVLQNPGDVNTATDASCDDDLVTAGHLDTTSISGMRYRLNFMY